MNGGGELDIPRDSRHQVRARRDGWIIRDDEPTARNRLVIAADNHQALIDAVTRA